MEKFTPEVFIGGNEIKNDSEKKNFFVKIPENKLDLAMLEKIDFSTVFYLDNDQVEDFLVEQKRKHGTDILAQITVDPLYLVMTEKIDESDGKLRFVETETIPKDIPEYKMEIVTNEPGDEVKISLGFNPWLNREQFRKVKRVVEYKSKDIDKVRAKYLEKERIRESEKEPQYESVYIVVPKNKLKTITQEGLKINKNESLSRNYDLELIFKDLAKNYMSNGLDRTNCIFAYPVDPRSMKLGGLKSDVDSVVLKTVIDAKKAVVANGTLVSDAWDAYDSGDMESAQYYAERYWQQTTSLKQYLESDRETTIEYSPEVLIFEDIDPTKIEVV